MPQRFFQSPFDGAADSGESAYRVRVPYRTAADLAPRNGMSPAPSGRNFARGGSSRTGAHFYSRSERQRPEIESPRTILSRFYLYRDGSLFFTEAFSPPGGRSSRPARVFYNCTLCERITPPTPPPPPRRQTNDETCDKFATASVGSWFYV